MYHRGDSDYGLRDYVYLWNLLEAASRSAAPVRVIADLSPYAELMEGQRYRRLMAKGLGSPRNVFGRGGRDLGTTLFLYDDRGMQYFWHGREEVEALLERLLREGAEYLSRFV